MTLFIKNELTSGKKEFLNNKAKHTQKQIDKRRAANKRVNAQRRLTK